VCVNLEATEFNRDYPGAASLSSAGLVSWKIATTSSPQRRAFYLRDRKPLEGDISR